MIFYVIIIVIIIIILRQDSLQTVTLCIPCTVPRIGGGGAGVCCGVGWWYSTVLCSAALVDIVRYSLHIFVYFSKLDLCVNNC